MQLVSAAAGAALTDVGTLEWVSAALPPKHWNGCLLPQTPRLAGTAPDAALLQVRVEVLGFFTHLAQHCMRLKEQMDSPPHSIELIHTGAGLPLQQTHGEDIAALLKSGGLS